MFLASIFSRRLERINLSALKEVIKSEDLLGYGRCSLVNKQWRSVANQVSKLFVVMNKSSLNLNAQVKLQIML